MTSSLSVFIVGTSANGYLTFMLNLLLLRSYRVVCILDGSPSFFLKSGFSETLLEEVTLPGASTAGLA